MWFILYESIGWYIGTDRPNSTWFSYANHKLHTVYMYKQYMHNDCIYRILKNLVVYLHVSVESTPLFQIVISLLFLKTFFKYLNSISIRKATGLDDTPLKHIWP